MSKTKLNIGDKVTAWRYPKNKKSNVGEVGIITDVYKRPTGKNKEYKIELADNRGFVFSTVQYLTPCV